MEAVPKLPLLSFALKFSPDATQFGPKLKQYIAEAYREDPDNYGNEINQLETLRGSAVRPTSDAAGLKTVTRYFCQLRAMQSRFPMTKGQPAAVNFVWNLFANNSCSSADIRFEMACILYNIGALHSQLGASEPRTSPESLKATCQHYQQAAWAFQHLKEHYPQPPDVDVCPDVVRLLQEICFAQAQECIMEKSIQDTKKSSVVGSVATQVLAFYKNSLAILGPSSGSDSIYEVVGHKVYNAWHRYLSFKSSYIGCLVSLYQGINAEEQQKMGERVAFYQQAVDRLAEAQKLVKYIEPKQVAVEALTFTNDVVEGKRKAAKNENEFIYHEDVPDKNLLAELKPVCVVKALAINFNDPEVSGQDIFAKLIPMGAHEASSLYSEEKAKLLRQIVDQAENKNTELTQFMSSLQLDQLDVLDSEQSIPQDIVDRCAAMNAKVDVIQSLVETMNNLAEIISDVENSLTDCKSMIQEETLKEKEYQKVMGPRPPSIVQTELSREFHKYQEAHNRTNDSNQVLHKAMTLHIANLKLLSLPLDFLESKIPSIDNIEGLDRETMLEMRRVVNKAREMQTQRSNLIQELRSDLNSDDITSILLSNSSQSTEEIFDQELKKHSQKVTIIEHNLAAQENIINKLTSLYASYGESRRLLSDVLRKREGLINALITSYDTHEELLGKSQKGLEFYKKMSHNVTQLLSRLKSTCQVQEEERAQMLAKQNKPAAPVTPPARNSDTPPAMTEGYKPTLKDYLPYMKTRGYGRLPAPTAQPEQTETYYPESIYPTSIRPAPVGSEATTDAPPGNYQDGYVVPSSAYNPYTNQYNESNAYAVPNVQPSTYGQPKLPYEVPKATNELENYGYNTPYVPSQYSSQMGNPNQQTYNPYYTGSQEAATAVTDTQNTYNMGTNQMNVPPNSQYNPYAHTVPTQQFPTIPEVPSSLPYQGYGVPNQLELSTNFAQMQVSVPKSDQTGYGNDYSNTYFSMHYPQVSTPNMATYSHAPQNSQTNLVPSQTPTDPSTINYPYGTNDQTVPSHQYNNPPIPNPISNEYNPYSYATTSGIEPPISNYPVYTNADTVSLNSIASASSGLNSSLPYSIPEKIPTPLPNFDDIDKPIKSHVTGQALTVSYPPTVSMNSNANLNYPTDTNVAQQPFPTYTDQGNAYGQVYQNHPGYTFNDTTGSYDYSYGSQSTYSAYNNMQVIDPQAMDNQQHWNAQGVYTSAGNCETVQSPSAENQQIVPQTPEPNNQLYYNNPYGYQTTMQTNTPNPTATISNFGSNVNQSTYMNSGQDHNTSVTYSKEQVTTDVEETQNSTNFVSNNQNVAYNYQNTVYIQNQPTSYYQNDTTNSEVISYPNISSNYHTTENFQNVVSNNSDVTNYVQQNFNNLDNSQVYNTENMINQQNEFTNQQTPIVNDQSFENQYSNNQDLPNATVTYNQNVSTTTVVYTEPQNQEQTNDTVENTEQVAEVINAESKTEFSTMDLLSHIDFSVELPALKPEIKVPRISEDSMKKAIYTPKEDLMPRLTPKQEEIVERPAKMDLFTDPSLVNRFTDEVKCLQKVVDSLSNKTSVGLTLLDTKWKSLQDFQTKENMRRSKTIASQRSSNVVTEVVPYDDSRLTLKSDVNAYINASLYKQLAPWCIPLVISSSPIEEEYGIFWKSILEHKVTCVLCLITEIEMQGKPYWPTAKGQTLDLEDGVKVTLDDVISTVHWTERKLTVSGRSVVNVTHYQINVFPAKIVCAPLVLLCDRLLNLTYTNRLSNQLSSAWVHCSSGGGRSAVVALLAMTMCQVRAGQLQLCEMLETGCLNLYKHRTNVLEDTKYLADVYRTALFYVHGVLCSGTTLFNGEIVSGQSGASVLPTVAPSTSTENKDITKIQKFSRESFEEMKTSTGLKSGDMKDPLNFLDPLWSLKKK